MSEFQRREAYEREILARQWQSTQRNIAVEQWQGMSLLKDSRYEPLAAQQTVDRLLPSYGDIFGRETPSRLGAPNHEISRRISDFAGSLPDEPKGLMGSLDQLLRQRVNDWRNPDLTELGVWSGSCRSILDKLANINNQADYKDSFRNRSTQEAWQTLQKKRASDNSWNAWQRAYSEVLTLIPHNRAEAQDPIAYRQKEEALRAIQDAEIRSGIVPSDKALPMIPNNGSMPPVAPQRQSLYSPGGDTYGISQPGMGYPQQGNEFGKRVTEADTSHFPRRKLKF
jgi:hypothetical protein